MGVRDQGIGRSLAKWLGCQVKAGPGAGRKDKSHIPKPEEDPEAESTTQSKIRILGSDAKYEF